MNKTVAEIKKRFEEMKCSPIVILKTPRAGEEVDNMHGVDFELDPYAVIHRGNFYSEKKRDFRKDLYMWEVRNKTGIMKFDASGCHRGIDALVQELHDRDGYEIVWRKK